MPNLPMTPTCEEVKSNIAKIEHNSAGQGSGPSGKRGGPPTGIEAGSGSNIKGGGCQPTTKGADWISPGSGRK